MKKLHVQVFVLKILQVFIEVTFCGAADIMYIQVQSTLW
jgi:hypothetical protein